MSRLDLGEINTMCGREYSGELACYSCLWGNLVGSKNEKTNEILIKMECKKPRTFICFYKSGARYEVNFYKDKKYTIDKIYSSIKNNDIVCYRKRESINNVPLEVAEAINKKIILLNQK